MISRRFVVVNFCAKRSYWRFADQEKRCARMLNRLLDESNAAIQRALNPTFIVSKGVPKIVEIKGNVKALKRRQKILNKNFMETISDILSNNTFGEELQKLNVVITQVEVTQDYQLLNVFWVTKSLEDQVNVSKKLQNLTGKLHKLIAEKNFMHKIPVVRFTFDQNTSGIAAINSLLEKVDLGDDHVEPDPTSFPSPSEALNSHIGKSKKNKVSTFVQEESNKNVVVDEPDVLNFTYPPDMKLNALGLDYEYLINKVLFLMKKSRAIHRNFNPVADPLPPAEWVSPPPFQEPNEEQPDNNTYERLKAMQSFIIENRKKRQRLAREMKREDSLLLESINDSLDEAIDNCNQRMLEEDDYDESDYISEE